MIAVLEDNDVDLAIYNATFLKKKKFRVFKTMQSLLSENRKYDVIIVDLNLPDAFGVEIIEKASSIAKKVIVITGTGEEYLTGKNYSQFMDAGAAEVFKKGMLSNEGYAKMIEKELDLK